MLQALTRAGLPVVRLPAHRPRSLAHALELKAKTDALDARLLAVAAECIQAAPTAVLPAPLQALRELLHLRITLVAQRDAQRRCMEHVTCKVVRAQWREVSALLQQRIGEVSRQIAQAGAACSSLPKLPGLGPILRATLAARLPELGTVPARKIVALVGLAPFNRDSGRWRGQRRIQGGRADVRRVLYMATWASIRTCSHRAHTYARLPRSPYRRR